MPSFILLNQNTTTTQQEILTNWLKTQHNREEAYIMMREALIMAKLKDIAKEVLDNPTPVKSRIKSTQKQTHTC